MNYDDVEAALAELNECAQCNQLLAEYHPTGVTRGQWLIGMAAHTATMSGIPEWKLYGYARIELHDHHRLVG
jgi:hypothetical protein